MVDYYTKETNITRDKVEGDICFSEFHGFVIILNAYFHS
jgi:hypothetical protein